MTTDHKTNCAAIGGQCDGGQNCARQGFFAFLCSGDDCQWRRLNHFCTRRWYNLLSRRPLWWTLWLTALSAARQERRSVVRWDFKTELWAGRTFCFSLPVWKSDVFTSQVMKKRHLKRDSCPLMKDFNIQLKRKGTKSWIFVLNSQVRVKQITVCTKYIYIF